MRPDETPLADGAREIWELPVLSQEFRDGPVITAERAGLRLKYDYETETGEYAWQEVTFRGMEAFMFTAHDSCNEQQVDAYDVLVEVVNSSWVAELRKARRNPMPDVRHMRIYFDEIGCYEFVASEFVPPEPRHDE